MGERHALVIASQCDGLPGQRLSFLPERAQRLYEALIDPAHGGCLPSPGGLVVDPDLTAMAMAVKTAVITAAAAGATLVVAFVGHAETLPDPTGGGDLFLMPRNGVVPPDSDTGYLLGQRLRELLGGPAAVGLDGLLLLVDACHAGVGALNVIQRAAGLMSSADIRLELLAATFDRRARDGCFSNTLIRLLSEGLPSLSADYIDTAALLDPVAKSCPQQEEPLRFAITRGRRISGDPGLWLAHNPEAAGHWVLTGTSAGGHAVELTRSYQLTDAIERVTSAMAGTRVTLLVGGPGSGKSAAVAALSRPELAPDLIPTGYLHAVAFADLTPRAAELADELAGQLRRMPEFVDAEQRYRTGINAEEVDRQPALQRRLVGPLRALTLATGRRVRIAVDGLDRLDPAVRRELADAVATLISDNRAAFARILLTTRPCALAGLVDNLPASTVRVDLDAPRPDEVAAYVAALGAPPRLVPLLVAHTHSWLDVKLFADVLTSAGIFNLGDVEDLGQLYSVLVAAATTALGPQVAPILTVLAAAGSGPVLPVGVAAAACARLDGPPDIPRLRNVLAGLGGLVARAHSGTDAEHVGLFHETLVGYLTAHPIVGNGEEAHRAILEALASTDDSRAAAYRTLRKPDHLWALGQRHEALVAIRALLGARAGDNVNTLRPWLDRAVAVLGPEDPNTLHIRHNLARYTGMAGDPAEALRLYRELLPDCERVLGPEHPDTLPTRYETAYWSGEAGERTEALQLFRELLPDCERVLGPDHPDTLCTRHQIAVRIGDMGERAEALRLLRELLPDCERVLGPDHLDTLRTRHRIAWCTGEAGDPAEALRLFRKLLPDCERVLGPEDPDTLHTRHNLARYTGMAGDPAEALRLYRELLPDCERVLGPEHPDTLRTRHETAYWTGEAGNPAEALRLYRELLPDRKRVLGLEHPDTLRTRQNLARYTGMAGDPAEALRLYRELLPDCERVFGPDHSATLRTRHQIAVWTADIAGG